MCSRAPRIVYACKEISACAFFGRVNILSTMLHIPNPRVLHFSAMLHACLHSKALQLRRGFAIAVTTCGDIYLYYPNHFLGDIDIIQEA